MFVSRKVVFGKLFSKLFCVCLLLGKLVNEKHFPVNEKHFLVNFNQRKIWLDFQESVFPLTVFVFRKITFQTFLCLFASRKVGKWKTLSSKRKIWLGFQGSVFLKNLRGKHFQEVVKNLEMSYYLLSISNSVLKLLIAIYIYIYIYILFWIFIFQFHLLKFYFYINFGSYFYNCYLLFPYHFFTEILYLSNLVFNFFIVTYFIWNNLWNVNYYYFNFFIFFLDLISIILIIFYFIWDNLWNYIIFFNFILIQLFNL